MRPSEIDDLLAALDEVVDRRCDEAIDGLAAAIECGRIADVRAASRELDVRQGVRESLGTPPFDIPNLINVGALRTEYAHDPKRLEDLLQDLSEMFAASVRLDLGHLASQVDEAGWGSSDGRRPRGANRALVPSQI